MNLLLGVGNELNGDDGIGPWVAKNFSDASWQTIDCFTMPENYTAMVKRLQPHTIVIVDAADMKIQPGEMRIIPQAQMESAAFSTHMLPLSIVVSYLQKAMPSEIWVIGIQPERFDGTISPAVLHSGKKLISMLAAGNWQTINRFRPDADK